MKRFLPFVIGALIAFSPVAFGQTIVPGGGGGSGGTPANPTATAGPAAVNGSATTYMRSDAAPAVQQATTGQKGIAQVGSGLAVSAGVMSAGDATVSGAVKSNGSGTYSQAACADLSNGAAGCSAAAANPTGTAGPTAVNGSASTYMRSDGAPAVQKASNAQFGIMEGDTSTISCTAGVCSAVGGGSGTVTSVATGAGLTGGPITSTGTIATTYAINAQTGTSYTFLTSDAAKLVTQSNASAIADTLPVATTSGFGAGYSFDVENLGAGLVTITPTTSTINGAATLTIPTNMGCTIVSDGTNYQVSACAPAMGVTGSGNLVRATSPTLVTPALGTPSAVVLTNGTGLVASTGTTATGTPSSSTYLRGDNTWATPSGAGTVTSVATNNGLTGGTITSSGTIGLATVSTGNTLCNTSGSTAAPSATLISQCLAATTITSASTITPNCNFGQYAVTAQAASGTIAAPGTCTPVDGQKLIIRITDNGTPQTISFNTIYHVISGITLPTVTLGSTTAQLYIGEIYNAQQSWWDVVAAN